MRDFSFVQDNMTAFINQYIIMLAKYKTDIFTNNCLKVHEEINRNNIQDIYFLYCQTENKYDADYGLDRTVIKEICSELFYSKNLENPNYLIRNFNFKQNKKNLNHKTASNYFFHQLLLVLEMEDICNHTRKKSYYNYLVKIPILVYESRIANEKIIKKSTISVDLGMKIVNDIIDQYRNIWYPLEDEEYRVDFTWVKSYYESIFDQYKFNVIQGGWNVID